MAPTSSSQFPVPSLPFLTVIESDSSALLLHSDGTYIYQLNPPHGTPKDGRLRFIPRQSTSSNLPTVSTAPALQKSGLKRSRPRVSMSQEMVSPNPRSPAQDRH